MIETYSGNSHAQQGEREFQKEAHCFCGSKSFKEVELCEHDISLECDHIKCPGGGAYNQKDGCKSTTAFRCEDCGEIKIP